MFPNLSNKNSPSPVHEAELNIQGVSSQVKLHSHDDPAILTQEAKKGVNEFLKRIDSIQNIQGNPNIGDATEIVTEEPTMTITQSPSLNQTMKRQGLESGMTQQLPQGQEPSKTNGRLVESDQYSAADEIVSAKEQADTETNFKKDLIASLPTPRAGVWRGRTGC